MADLATYKKAYFDFEPIEKFSAGIELFGTEVKAIRSGKASLEGSRIVVRGGEAFLVGATINPIQPKNAPENFDSERPRRLLLSKKELNALAAAENKKGLTIIPFSLYNKGKLIKVSLAIARGKKEYDKRETIKKRETEREIRRDFFNH